MKRMAAVIGMFCLIGFGIPGSADSKKAAPAATADSVGRDIKALEDLLAFHEKDKKMAADAPVLYRSDVCKRLRALYDLRAAELKDLWAALAGSMRQNDYPNTDKQTKSQLDGKFGILDALDKRMKALAERLDKLCPCPPEKKTSGFWKSLSDRLSAPPAGTGGRPR